MCNAILEMESIVYICNEVHLATNYTQSRLQAMRYHSNLYLLPGFGEDRKIFRKLYPYFSGFQTVDVDYRPVLQEFTADTISVTNFVARLITYYDIQPHDVLVGHSMGGFIAHNIRKVLHCEACLIASFTNPNKIKFPIQFEWLVKWLTYNGLFTSDIYKEAANFHFGNEHVALEEIQNTLAVFGSYKREDIFKLIKMLNGYRKKGLLGWLYSYTKEVKPSLIIHPANDSVLGAPDEKHITVPGDHFAPVTHPQAIGNVLGKWLLSLSQSRAVSEELLLEDAWLENYLDWVA